MNFFTDYFSFPILALLVLIWSVVRLFEFQKDLQKYLKTKLTMLNKNRAINIQLWVILAISSLCLLTGLIEVYIVIWLPRPNPYAHTMDALGQTIFITLVLMVIWLVILSNLDCTPNKKSKEDLNMGNFPNPERPQEGDENYPDIKTNDHA